tara:strand:+ start:245 stop:688 length:444 start_codon:yes stop_codon:yes gene_type:complete
MTRLQHIEESFSVETGEVTTVKKTFAAKVKTKQDFFMVFLNGLNSICELTRPSDIKVLVYMCSKAEYNTGKVRITSEDRATIIDKLNICKQSLTNSLTRLVSVGLVSGSRGSYEVNPQAFWKGETNERERILKAKSVSLLIEAGGLK